MKKIIALILVLSLSLFAFAACGKKNKGETPDNNQGTTETPDNNQGNNNTPVENTYTLAIAIQSVEITGRSTKLGTNVIALVYNAEGKIVAARFDSTEISTPSLDENGDLVAVDTASKVESNYKKGQMAATWGEQADAYATYIKGMTAAEVAALDATNKELVAGCTMASTSYSSMINFQQLVAMAFASEHTVSFKSATEDFKLGAAMDLALSKKTDRTTGALSISVVADCAGSVVAADGKVVASIIDTAEQSYAVAEDGTITLNALVDSKRAQGDAYDSYKPMAGGRWYAQVDAFAATANGKTVADLNGLATEGVAGCTISVETHKPVLVEAATRAH